MPEDWLLTTQDIAEALDVSRFTARRMIVLGYIPCARQRKLGERTTYRVALSELVEFARVHSPEDVQRIVERINQRMAS